MNDVVTGLVVVASAVAALAVVVQLIRDIPAGDRTFLALAVVEAMLLVQVVTGFIALGQTTREVDGVLFGSYLVAILAAAPVGAFWSLAERTRAGTAVLLLAVLTVLALELRLTTIWSGNA